MKFSQDIEKLFTEEQLREATKRLCNKCYRGGYYDPDNWKDTGCNLYPFTTEGKDCPYLKTKERL